MFRAESGRLSRRYPTLGGDERERLVLRALARAFLDLEVAELAQALIEGGEHAGTRRRGAAWQAAIARARAALEAAQAERQDSAG